MGASSCHCCATPSSHKDTCDPRMVAFASEPCVDVSFQDKHLGNHRCEKMRYNTTGVIRTNPKMPHAFDLAETRCGTPPLIAQPCSAATQDFTVVNRTGHHLKCLLAAPDGGRGEEFTLLLGAEKVVNMRSQYGLLSIAFCESDGNRCTLAISQEQVVVQAGVPFVVSPQEKHSGNCRYERSISNPTDLVRTFANMSLAHA